MAFIDYNDYFYSMRKEFVFLLLALFALSCSSEEEKIRRKNTIADKKYMLDTSRTSFRIVAIHGIEPELELRLFKDGKFDLKSESPALHGYDGTWDLSGPLGSSSFVFKFQNGIIQKIPTLAFDVKLGDTVVRLYFKTK